MFLSTPLLLAALAWPTPSDPPARPDVVVADFEGDDYAGWTATGNAFGTAPARGTLPGQMEVTGFLGRGLANSFVGGDGSTGTLTSPPFRVERRHLNFLIGGGAQPGKTAVLLLVDGKEVRTETGPNDRPGGSERLDWASWDVSEFLGRSATLKVVDLATGGWGHVNVDHVVQSDTPRGLRQARRDVEVTARYLHLPVLNANAVRRIKVVSPPAVVIREFDIKLAGPDDRPDYWVACDLAPWLGSSVRVEGRLPEGSHSLASLKVSDTFPGGDEIYRERDRPQFHFTSRRGWLNDPNGLVWFAGEYHLFYQHNPYGWDWGNMHWGHAVSPDLVRWTELGEALTPRSYGDWAFSGSAVVDTQNTSGFGRDGTVPMVAAYTSTGRGECIVYSLDRGRTWTEYEGNPVFKHEGRDPRLLWHAPSGRWVMAVYDETKGARDVVFLTSGDLKSWKVESRIGGFFECPDLFELPAEGRPGASRWVLSAADGEYLLGSFDGRKFSPDSPKKGRVWYGDYYAAQTFSQVPDGRRIQIGWGRDVKFPGMPFNQQMTVPVTLTLHETGDGLRVFARPVRELESLRGRGRSWTDVSVDPGGENPLAGISSDLLEVIAEADVPKGGKLTISLRGVPVVYDEAHRTLNVGGVSAPLDPEGRLVRLHLFLDRGSVEAFANGGRIAVSRGVVPPPDRKDHSARAEGGVVTLRRLDVYPLTSAWDRPAR